MKFTGIALLTAYAVAASTEGDSKGDPVALTANGKPLEVHQIGDSGKWLAQVPSDPNAKPDKVWYVQDGDLYVTDGGGQHAAIPEKGGPVVLSNKQQATSGFKIHDKTITFNGVNDWYLCTRSHQPFLALFQPTDKLPEYKCERAQILIV